MRLTYIILLHTKNLPLTSVFSTDMASKFSAQTPRISAFTGLDATYSEKIVKNNILVRSYKSSRLLIEIYF